MNLWEVWGTLRRHRTTRTGCPEALQFHRFSAQQPRVHSGVRQEGSKKNKFLAEKTGSPH